jgi:Trk K+ transport system NAD-binding subunit
MRVLIVSIEDDGFVSSPRVEDRLKADDVVVALIDQAAAEECPALLSL